MSGQAAGSLRRAMGQRDTALFLVAAVASPRWIATAAAAGTADPALSVLKVAGSSALLAAVGALLYLQGRRRRARAIGAADRLSRR